VTALLVIVAALAIGFSADCRAVTGKWPWSRRFEPRRLAAPHHWGDTDAEMLAAMREVDAIATAVEPFLPPAPQKTYVEAIVDFNRSIATLVASSVSRRPVYCLIDACRGSMRPFPNLRVSICERCNRHVNWEAQDAR